MMLPVSPTFFLTHDDHLPHNTFASAARRCSDRLQLGMSDFLRRNPQRRPQMPLSLRQVDPLIRQLTLYRDFIQDKTKENKE